MLFSDALTNQSTEGVIMDVKDWDEEMIKGALIFLAFIAFVIFFVAIVVTVIRDNHQRQKQNQVEYIHQSGPHTVCSDFLFRSGDSPTVVHLLSTGDFYYKISKWYIIPIKWYKVANKEKSFFMPRA